MLHSTIGDTEPIPTIEKSLAWNNKWKSWSPAPVLSRPLACPPHIQFGRKSRLSNLERIAPGPRRRSMIASATVGNGTIEVTGT